MSRHLLLALVTLLALLAGACASHVDTAVTRFHEGHLPAGASYRVVPGEGVREGPEFAQYAAMIRDEMALRGYREAGDAPADLVLEVDYGVSEGRTKITTRPGRVYPSYSYRLGYFHHPFYYGFYDPFYHDGFLGPDIRTETVYSRSFSMRIADPAQDRTLFEGRAVSEGPTGEIAAIMPYLVESMFRNFPGENGATKIVEIETRDGKRY